MVNAVQIRHADLIRFFPKQIYYVDCLARIVDVKHRSQPTLLIQCFAFNAQFHPFSAWLDLQVRNVWIKPKALCERNALSALLGIKQKVLNG